MKFQRHFLSIGTLPIVSLLLIILGAAHGPVCATELQARSEAERFVLAKVYDGQVNLRDFPEGKRELSASLIAKLLTSADARLKPNGVSIWGAVITGDLDLTDQQIRYDVSMGDCTFTGDVTFDGSSFAGRLDLR